MIHHMSFHNGSSVNNSIPPEHTSVKYATIEDAIRLVKQNGKGCFLAKTDIKNAFRIIPIQSANYPLMGMKWDGLYYHDLCMPMGCSSSCKPFETFVAPSEVLCKQQLQLFLDLCDYLGSIMEPKQTIGPFSTLSFAGIELDSQLQIARLPKDKLEEFN